MALFISQNPLNFASQKVSPRIYKLKKNHIEDERISGWITARDKRICFTNVWRGNGNFGNEQNL